jgi:hypothetical protein
MIPMNVPHKGPPPGWEAEFCEDKAFVECLSVSADPFFNGILY